MPQLERLQRHAHGPASGIDVLATACPGSRYRVTGVLFDIVRDRCRELGCFEGDELTCLANEESVLLLRDAAGRKLEWQYAWFVQVETLGSRQGGTASAAR